VRTILILAANPKGTDRLRLDEEVKRIEQGLERAKKRDQFEVVKKWAVTDDDLRRALLDYKPEVVHFAGHGTGDGQGGTGRDLIPAGEVDAGGLVLEDDVGNVQLISGDALAGLFQLFSNSVKCVVLNACYSESQANAITRHIDFVVGMKKAIGDPAAIKFAVGFYDALFAERDFDDAFKFGCNAIGLKRIPEHLTPILKKNDRAVTVNTSSPTAPGTIGGRIDKEDVRSSIRDSIERRLKRLGRPEVTKFPVLRELERELRSADDESEFPESKDPIPVILEALLDQRSLINISRLSEIYDQCWKNSEPRAAEIVAEIIDEVTPLVIKPELAIRIWDEIKVRKTAMFFTPVDQSAAAEVLMACADRKSIKVKPPREFPVKDFDGAPLLRGGGSSFGGPVTQESLAKSILLDLCEGQGMSESSNQPQTLDVLVERFAGILIDNSRGVTKGRTLYGFHKMPEDPRDHAVHTDALTLIRDELAKTKQKKPNEFRGLPGFVFLVLARKSEHEGLQTVVVQMLKRRFEREKNRIAHGAND